MQQLHCVTKNRLKALNWYPNRTTLTKYLPFESNLESSSVEGCFRKFKLDIEESKDYEEIISNAVAKAGDCIQALVSHHPIKAQVVLELRFFHDSYEGREYASKVFRSIVEPIILGDDLEKYLSRSRIYLKGQIELYRRNGSGWQFDGFNAAFLEASHYHPMAGSGKVKIPQTVKREIFCQSGAIGVPIQSL